MYAFACHRLIQKCREHKFLAKKSFRIVEIRLEIEHAAGYVEHDGLEGRGSKVAGWGPKGRGEVGTAVCGRYSCGADYVLELSSATDRPRLLVRFVPRFFSLNKTSNASTLVGGQLVKCYREGSGRINCDQHGFGGAVVLESWPRSLRRRETEGRRASSVFARDGQEGF